ncbi:MAG TPA: M23 family metallopeptidase, partial [Candidatus Lokiarchaeia archaeon]
IKPLIDNAIKINVELHGLNKYTVRFDELIYPVKDIEFAYISSEFGIREVNYSLWKKKHYTFLKEYSEDDKKIMYVDENYEFKGEWVTNNKRYEIHYGIDICNSYEGGIIASGDGIVDKVGWNDSAGNYIMIKHFIEGKVKFTYYGHLSKIKVNKGQIVAQGQDIGNMGQTGFEQTGKHVHFAIFEYNLKTNKTIYDNAVINTTYYGKKIMDSSI